VVNGFDRLLITISQLQRRPFDLNLRHREGWLRLFYWVMEAVGRWLPRGWMVRGWISVVESERGEAAPTTSPDTFYVHTSSRALGVENQFRMSMGGKGEDDGMRWE